MCSGARSVRPRDRRGRLSSRRSVRRRLVLGSAPEALPAPARARGHVARNATLAADAGRDPDRGEGRVDQGHRLPQPEHPAGGRSEESRDGQHAAAPVADAPRALRRSELDDRRVPHSGLGRSDLRRARCRTTVGGDHEVHAPRPARSGCRLGRPSEATGRARRSDERAALRLHPFPRPRDRPERWASARLSLALGGIRHEVGTEALTEPPDRRGLHDPRFPQGRRSRPVDAATRAPRNGDPQPRDGVQGRRGGSRRRVGGWRGDRRRDAGGRRSAPPRRGRARWTEHRRSARPA